MLSLEDYYLCINWFGNPTVRGCTVMSSWRGGVLGFHRLMVTKKKLLHLVRKGKGYRSGPWTKQRTCAVEAIQMVNKEKYPRTQSHLGYLLATQHSPSFCTAPDGGGALLPSRDVSHIRWSFHLSNIITSLFQCLLDVYWWSRLSSSCWHS